MSSYNVWCIYSNVYVWLKVLSFGLSLYHLLSYFVPASSDLSLLFAFPMSDKNSQDGSYFLHWIQTKIVQELRGGHNIWWKPILVKYCGNHRNTSNTLCQ